MPVRHVNRRDGSGADERIHGLDEEVPVRRIKALAGLVEDQQTGILDQRPRQENHPLQPGGEGKEGLMREFEQLEPRQPAARRRSLTSRRRLEQADGVVESRGDHLEAGRRVIEMQVQLR